ncbi:MAG TPA: MaoC family dehydratase [Candidatus Binatia bacterium]|nr:MaoC family dehydratase [Candidatus Binatia bacterium]
MSNIQPPIDDRYFEDYPVGETFEYAPITVAEADVLRFAREFDPQKKHADPQSARDGPFGGLIASGWHTVAMVMRVLVDNYFSAVADIASPGVDELRWPNPVRPGDRLRVRATVLDARISKSKPDRGIVTSLVKAVNQRGEPVLTFKGISLVLRRL